MEQALKPEYELIIEAGKSERHYWRDLWVFRELFLFLSWRDIAVRYKQTFIGVTWALIQPLITLVVMTVVFSVIAKMDAGVEAPYAVMVAAGTLPWQFFATSLGNTSNSLVTNANMLSKVYFPRLIVPVSAVIVSFVDFLISFAILALVMVWFQFVPSWRIVFLPLFTLLAFSAAIGIGLWMATLNVEYRDFRYIVPFIIQFGVFVTPVGYNASKVPDSLYWLYVLNPMVGVIEGFRWSIIGGDSPINWTSIAISAGICVVLIITSIKFFRRMERTFADVI